MSILIRKTDGESFVEAVRVYKIVDTYRQLAYLVVVKAMTIPSHGGPEVLRFSADFPDPVPASNEVVIKVKATGVNRMDFLVRNGYPGLSLPLPHVCGGDIAGTVAGYGADVTGLAHGTRVVVYPLVSCGTCTLCRSGRSNLCINWRSIGIHLKGGYAEYAAVPRDNVVPLPDEVSFEDAAALSVAGLTAYHAVKTVGNLQANESFFVWGGAGTIGSMAVQIAKHSGATVISTARTEERAAVVRSLGADIVAVRTSNDVHAMVREIAHDGVDCVLDFIGAGTFEQSFTMLTNGGRLLLCGIMTGKTVELDIHQTYFHHRSVHGLFLGTRVDMESVLDLVATGHVRPLIDDVLPLQDAAEAHRKVAAGDNVGKIILKL